MEQVKPALGSAEKHHTQEQSHRYFCRLLDVVTTVQEKLAAEGLMGIIGHQGQVHMELHSASTVNVHI
jgi:hypothetical protein